MLFSLLLSSYIFSFSCYPLWQKKRTPFMERPVLCQFIFFPLLFFPGLFCRPARNSVKKFIPRRFHFILNAFFVFSASSFFFFSAASASCFARAALAFPYCFLRKQEFRNSSRYNRFPLHTYNRARSPPEWCRRYTPHWWTRHHRSRPP